MNWFTKLIASALVYILNMEQRKRLISKLATGLNVNLLGLAYQNVGISLYQDLEVSGEQFFLNQVLRSKLAGLSQLVFFDVGANVGDYSLLLHQLFPKAIIYAFEPNPPTYERLLQMSRGNTSIEPINSGLSDQNQSIELFSYKNDNTTGHATIYDTVLTDLHHRTDVYSQEVLLSTIDSFCQQKGIDSIDFLKIDTEGHELSVLGGAKEMIKSKSVKVIQFEFNEMNIVSRVFLKDFFNVLVGYNIYRISKKELIPLFPYSSNNEIFKFQNIVAIHHSVD